MKNIEKGNITGWRILKGIEKDGKNLGIYGKDMVGGENEMSGGVHLLHLQMRSGTL